MKNKEKLLLAIYNVWTMKKQFLSYWIILISISTLLTTIMIFSKAILSEYNRIINEMISTNSIYVCLSLDEEGRMVQDDNSRLCDQIIKNKHISEGLDYSEIDLYEYFNDSKLGNVDIENITIAMDGKEYAGINDYSYDFEVKKHISNERDKYLFSVPFRVQIRDLKSDFISDNVRKEFAYRYPKHSMFICGRENENANEIMISEYMLKRFGIVDHYEQLLNKKITIAVNGQDFIKEYTLVGILSEELFRVSYMSESSQFIIAGDPEIYKKYKCIWITREFGIDSFANASSVMKELDKVGYGEYDTTMFFYQYEISDKLRLVTNRFVLLFISLIVIALFIKLISNIYMSTKKRIPYLGVLQALGMIKKDVLTVLGMELGCILLMSQIIAGFLSVAVAKGLFMWTNSVMEQVFELNMWSAIGESIKIGIGISIVVISFTLFIANRKISRKIIKNIKEVSV